MFGKLKALIWGQHYDRAIFRYWNGTKIVGIDPMVALSLFSSDPEFVWDKHLAGLDGPDEKFQAECAIVCRNAARRVFNLQTWSEWNRTETGVTDLEAMGVLNQFIEFVDRLKKNIEPPPTSPASTVPQSSEPTSPTSACSVSG